MAENEGTGNLHPLRTPMLFAIVAPPIIALLFLNLFDSVRQSNPLDGIALANRDKRMFWGLGITLLVFVLVASAKLRGSTRLLFILAAAVVSVMTWLAAFFSRIAG